MKNWLGKTKYPIFVQEFPKNTRVFLRLRRYHSPKQRKQLYHTLIYPDINYAIASWGSAFTSNLKKIQVQQNLIVRLIFFATLYGRHTESAFPLLNLLDLLSVERIFAFQLLKFCHQWHKKQLPDIFDEHFRYACDVHSYNTRYASKANFYKEHFRTNAGKRTALAMAVKLWQELPIELKHVKHFNFRKKVKQYLLIKQIHCQS